MTRKQKVWAGCAQMVALAYGSAFVLHVMPDGHWATLPTVAVCALAFAAALGWTWAQFGYVIGVLDE